MDQNIERNCKAALRRIDSFIHKFAEEAEWQLQNPVHWRHIILTIHNREQFYKIVNWCNKNIGKGSQYWTARGRVLKFIDPTKKAYNPPVTRIWVIKVPGIDISPLLNMADVKKQLSLDKFV